MTWAGDKKIQAQELHVGGCELEAKEITTDKAQLVVVHNCTIFLCSLDVGITDDQCRGLSVKEKGHLAW